MKTRAKKIVIFILILSILIIWVLYLYSKLFTSSESIINNNLEKSFDFSKYYSDQCLEWEIRISWLRYYSDWTIKVRECAKSFSCPEWKKVTPHCWLLWEYSACSLRCFWEGDLIPDWS